MYLDKNIDINLDIKIKIVVLTKRLHVMVVF